MTWLRAEPGQRKLAALTRCLAAVAIITLAGAALLRFLPDSATGELVSIVLGGCGTVAGLYAAMVGGNAAEHKHAARAPEGES